MLHCTKFLRNEAEAAGIGLSRDYLSRLVNSALIDHICLAFESICQDLSSIFSYLKMLTISLPALIPRTLIGPHCDLLIDLEVVVDARGRLESEVP